MFPILRMLSGSLGFREDLLRAVLEQGHLVLSYNGYGYVYLDTEPSE